MRDRAGRERGDSRGCGWPPRGPGSRCARCSSPPIPGSGGCGSPRSRWPRWRSPAGIISLGRATVLAGEPVTIVLFAGVLAMISNLAVDESTLAASGSRRAHGAAGVRLDVAGTLLSPYRVVADVVFVAVMVGCGLRPAIRAAGIALGMGAFMPFFFTQFLQAKPAQLPALCVAVVVGLGSTPAAAQRGVRRATRAHAAPARRRLPRPGPRDGPARGRRARRRAGRRRRRVTPAGRRAASTSRWARRSWSGSTAHGAGSTRPRCSWRTSSSAPPRGGCGRGWRTSCSRCGSSTASSSLERLGVAVRRLARTGAPGSGEAHQRATPLALTALRTGLLHLGARARAPRAAPAGPRRAGRRPRRGGRAGGRHPARARAGAARGVRGPPHRRLRRVRAARRPGPSRRADDRGHRPARRPPAATPVALARDAEADGDRDRASRPHRRGHRQRGRREDAGGTAATTTPACCSPPVRRSRSAVGTDDRDRRSASSSSRRGGTGR